MNSISKKVSKLFKVALTAAMTFSMIVSVSAAEEPKAEITNIVANTVVGYNDKEIVSFEITMNSKEAAEALKAEDFDITGNGPSCYFDAQTDGSLTGYEDDGISLSVNGNVVTMTVKQFGINGCGFPATAWAVNCLTDESLSFTLADVNEVKTKTLDDVVYGTYTYAGITREYALYMPANATGPVPLVIWNHGGGEYAMDIKTNVTKNRGITAWNEEGYECAVLMIQVSNPNYSYGAARSEEKVALIDQNNALQAAIVRDLIAQGKVDQNRVYVTGASSGGGATMRFLMQYPEMVAGAIAMCSMDPIVPIHTQSGCTDQSLETLVPLLKEAFTGKVYTWDEASQSMVQKDVDTESLVNTPIYFTHAENDPTCQVVSSYAYKQALEELGATQNQIKVFSNEEMVAEGLSAKAFGGALLHWSWCKVFDDAGEGTPMAWLFKQAITPATNGTQTVKDENSPTGYTVSFVYDASKEEKEIASVVVSGPFNYQDPTKDYKDPTNAYAPEEYVNGMYATNCIPGATEPSFWATAKWGRNIEMTYNAKTKQYSTSFPITSGSFAYSYIITYTDGTTVTTDDPANPSPAKKNPNSNTATGDLTHSIAYGHWDAEKQSKSPNLDYVLPVEGSTSQQFYVEYEGTLAKDQDLGIYLPANYDANREEPYKVIYVSHGGGGNETDWFAMAHADNMMDHIIADNADQEAILVTMSNGDYGWDMDKILENVVTKVIPYVEANYNVSKEAKDRAFCGLSMGGKTTTHMFFDHADLFGYFGIFSGTDMEYAPTTDAVKDPIVFAGMGNVDFASKTMIGENCEFTANLTMTKKFMVEDFDTWCKENIGDHYVTENLYVYGSHDWFTWSQLFYTFASKVVWSNEEVKEPVDQPTDQPSQGGTTGGTTGGNTSGTTTPTVGLINNGAYVALATVALAAAGYVAFKKKEEE